MRVQTIIEEKLTAALAPERLVVIDESHRHQGHAGARPDGESHFRVEIISAEFAGKSLLARQRLVYALLAEEMRQQIHALALTTRTPAEAAQ
ncbi:MAG TPA: BolA family transcriptional regulator [Rhodospirillaceae bacterium]|nr:BolA family transcriptional regulator [Rhodospirillaceae bacterium]